MSASSGTWFLVYRDAMAAFAAGAAGSDEHVRIVTEEVREGEAVPGAAAEPFRALARHHEPEITGS